MIKITARLNQARFIGKKQTGVRIFYYREVFNEDFIL